MTPTESKIYKILSSRSATYLELSKIMKKNPETVNRMLGRMFGKGMLNTRYDIKALKTRGSSAIWEAS